MNIFIDLDGTIFEASKRNYFVYQKVISELGGKSMNIKKYWSLKRANRPLKDILRLSNLSLKSKHLFQELFLKYVESDKALSYDQPFVYSKPSLKKLHSLNHKLFLISFRANSKKAKLQLKKFGLADFFSKIMIGKNKLDSKLSKIHFIKQALNKRSDPAIIIGDTEDDILVAKYLKFTSIAVISGIRNKEELTKFKPDYLVRNIKFLNPLIFSS